MCKKDKPQDQWLEDFDQSLQNVTDIFFFKSSSSAAHLPSQKAWGVPSRNWSLMKLGDLAPKYIYRLLLFQILLRQKIDASWGWVMEVVCHTWLLSLPHRTCLGVNLIQPEGKLDADTGFFAHCRESQEAALPGRSMKEWKCSSETLSFLCYLLLNGSADHILGLA